jgi:hypothetical protein
MSLQAWLENPPQWGIPAIEAIHIAAIATTGGAVLLFDLRLLRLLFADHPLVFLERESRKLFAAAFSAAALTGGLLYFSEPVEMGAHFFFRLKMALLLAAIALQAGARTAVALGALRDGPRATLIGGASALAWLMVASAGRWIGFS